MDAPLAFLIDRFLPQREAAISLDDLGFALGVTVTEQLRTFDAKIFHIEDHVARLFHSLDCVGVTPELSADDISSIAERLVKQNHPLLDEGDDLGLAIFVTPGASPLYCDGQSSQPRVGLHTYRLPFSRWAEKYASGESLVVPAIRQVPRECWPPELKCRSRMHYFLADREAAARLPGARALLLDTAGHVTEASTANVLVYLQDEGLVSPPRADVLPGISLAVLLLLAEELGITAVERPLSVADVERANEVLLSSTPFCVLPVARVGDSQVGDGRAGPIFRMLLGAFSELVGLDIAEQARRFAKRG